MTPDSRRPSPFARYAWATLAYTVAVVLWGAVVRATGAGAGCGAHWPKCDGEVIPPLSSTAQMIEFTHRVTSGLAFLAVAVMLVWAWRAFPKGSAVRAGAAVSMALMVVEAAVGAALVLLEYVAFDQRAGRAYWMAVHLVTTFALLAAITLTGWWASGGRRFRFRGQGALGGVLAAAIAATMLVGLTGAVTALGDTLFPKTEVGFALAPSAHFLERLRVVHPLLAVATGVLVVFAARMAGRLRPSPTTQRLATALTVLFGVQLGAGIVNVVLLAPVWMQIVHLLLADAVWLALILTAASALAVDDPAPAITSLPERERRPEPATA